MSHTSEPGPQHLGTLWLLDLNEPSLVGPIPRVEVNFQRIDSEAAPALAQAMGLDSPDEVFKRFNASKRCYIGNVDGVLATYGWVTFDKELIGELRLHIRLSDWQSVVYVMCVEVEFK